MEEKCYKDAILSQDYLVNNVEVNNIMLTGATGFVGSHILSELLKQTNSEIFVLVRAENEDTAFERIKQLLEKLMLWNHEQADRIHVLCGDLEKEKLGLSNSMWNILANSIDLIIHDAAYVNLMGTYDKHYAPNVYSTLQILELVAMKKRKRLVYVSTSGIFGGLYTPDSFDDDFTIMEDDDIPTVRSVFSYLRTKWVADRLVQQAAKRGINTAIFRLPHVGCDNITGYFNKGDIFWSRLKAFSKLGKIPYINNRFFVIPVDYLAKTLVYISLKSFEGLKFYTTLSDNEITWMSIADGIKNAGYDIEIIGTDEWYEYVKNYIKETNDIDVKMMFAYAENNFKLFRTPKMSNANFMSELPPEMREDTDINEIVANYFRYGIANNI